jgi:ribonuclease P protein component
VAQAVTALSFQPKQRLLHKAQFDAVYQQGIRVADPCLTVHALKQPTIAWPRLGMSVSTKNAGSSVRRNQLRRWIREDFRLRQNTLPVADIVVTIRFAAKTIAHEQLNQVLSRVYGLMIKRLQASIQDQTGGIT